MELIQEPFHPDQIKSCSQQFVAVGERTYSKSFVIIPDKKISFWLPRRLEEIKIEDIAVFFEFDLEVIILGGATFVALPPPLLESVYQHRIGIEVMELSSACRTYNLLLADERKVGLGLTF